MKKVTCKICNICDNTGTRSDMNPDIHKGFTVGKGKRMYWYIIWHGSGHCSVYTSGWGLPGNDKESKRYLKGDQEITIHFKQKIMMKRKSIIQVLRKNTYIKFLDLKSTKELNEIYKNYKIAVKK